MMMAEIKENQTLLLKLQIEFGHDAKAGELYSVKYAHTNTRVFPNKRVANSLRQVLLKSKVRKIQYYECT